MGRPSTALPTGRVSATGGLLPLSAVEVYRVDESRVPVLFSRSDVKAACAAAKRGGPDAALASLHASPRAVRLLHGPAHLGKLGLAGALPLQGAPEAADDDGPSAEAAGLVAPASPAAADASSAEPALTSASSGGGEARLPALGEVEGALSASRGDLAAALDLLALDPRVLARAALWRCTARVAEALGPSAAQAFSAAARGAGPGGSSGEAVARALAHANAAGEEAAHAAVAAAQAAANEAAEAAAAAKAAAAAAAAAVDAAAATPAVAAAPLPVAPLPVLMPAAVDPAAAVAAALLAARRSGDADLAQRLAIGFAPAPLDVASLCPRAAAEAAAKLAKGHRGKGSRRPPSGSPAKAAQSSQVGHFSPPNGSGSGSGRPGSRGSGSEDCEDGEEAAAARRFDAIAAAVARACRVADYASQQLLLPPRAADLRLQRPPPLSRAAANGAAATPANDDPSLDAWATPATDGRVSSLGAICAPTPWLLEARAAVVAAVATVVAGAACGLPNEVAAQLNALWHDDALFDTDRGGAGGEAAPELSHADFQASAALERQARLAEARSDLAGLLPNWLLDAAVSRAVVREATAEHSYRPRVGAGKEGGKAAAAAAQAAAAAAEAAAAAQAAEAESAKGGKKGGKAAPAPKGGKGETPEPSAASAAASAASSGYAFAVPPGPRTRAPPCPARPWPPPASEEDAAVASARADNATADGELPAEEAAAQAQAQAERAALQAAGPAVAVGGGPGCAAAVRWRYVVCEAARALVCDDAALLTLVGGRKVQRLLAPALPFTQLPTPLLRAAGDLAGGNVRNAAALLARDGQVLAGGWADGEAPLARLLLALTGASSDSGNGDAGVLRGASGEGDGPPTPMLSPKDFWAGGGGGGDSDDDDRLGPLLLEGSAPPGHVSPFALELTSSPAPPRMTLQRQPSATGRSVKPAHGGWTVDLLLEAADRGAAPSPAASHTKSGGNKAPKALGAAGSAPVRQLLPALRARATWLSATLAVPISEPDLVLALLQASAGLTHYCALPCPPHLEAAQAAAAQNAAAAAAQAAEAGRAGDAAAHDAPHGGLLPPRLAASNAGPAYDGGAGPSAAAACDVHCAVAFERLYALPQVAAGTSLATRGAVAYQRKLDLARVVPEADAARLARLATGSASGNASGKASGSSSSGGGKRASGAAKPAAPSAQAQVAADSPVPLMAAMSERFEVSVPRLGWWCVGSSARPLASVRGRLVFGAAAADAFLGAAPYSGSLASSSGGGLRQTADSSQVGSVGEASSGQPAGGKARSQAPAGSGNYAADTAAFFANSRAFFDPSLPAPQPPPPHSLAARAQLLASRLTVVTAVRRGSKADDASAPSRANSGSGAWASPPGALGVVAPGLDEVVVCFAAEALAGAAAWVEVRMDAAPSPASSPRCLWFGPFAVPAAGGDVDVGELVCSTPQQ